MRTLMTAAALTALLAAAPAFAQDPAPVDTPAATQAAPDQTTTPQATTPPAMNDNSATVKSQDQVQTPAPAAQPYLAQQSEGQWLATDLIGVTVQNPQGDKLGDVNDLVVADNGPVQAVVIGVGGFLGIGEKSVAVAFDRIQRSTDESGKAKFVLTASKEELDQAPPFVTTAEMQRQQQMNEPATTSSTTAPATN
jgi:sporulation protein YlmC with PRC-barrel domain